MAHSQNTPQIVFDNFGQWAKIKIENDPESRFSLEHIKKPKVVWKSMNHFADIFARRLEKKLEIFWMITLLPSNSFYGFCRLKNEITCIKTQKLFFDVKIKLKIKF